LGVHKEPIKHCLKITKSSHVDLQQKAIFAGDPMAFTHLGTIPRELDDPTHLAGRWTEPYPSRNRETKGGWIDIEPDAADCPNLLQSADPLSYRRRRNTKITSEH
jgi:hypothetical protein